MKVSACCFIKDTFKGAFCLFESMASLLPFVDEFVVMDLGSTDDTREVLYAIANENKKVKLVLEDGFPEEDAGVFATLANDVIEWCENDIIWYCQADEIPHQNVLKMAEERFERGEFNLSFWRIQLARNFQTIGNGVGWFPHIVHRIGRIEDLNFTGDGMNTERTFDAKLCSEYDAGWFPKWGGLGAEGIKPYLDNMILDVSLLGGFRDNIPDRRAMHAPFWHEEVIIEGKSAEQWQKEALQDQNWVKTESPYNIPEIMKYHVGRVKYELRRELFEALRADDTRKLLFP